MQHMFRCVSLIGRSWWAWRTNWITLTYLYGGPSFHCYPLTLCQLNPNLSVIPQQITVISGMLNKIAEFMSGIDLYLWKWNREIRKFQSFLHVKNRVTVWPSVGISNSTVKFLWLFDDIGNRLIWLAFASHEDCISSLRIWVELQNL